MEPTTIPSVIHSPKSHPIEFRIRQILNSGTGVNFRVAHKLFDLVEKEPAARGDHDESFPTYFLEWVELLILRFQPTSSLWSAKLSISLLAGQSQVSGPLLSVSSAISLRFLIRLSQCPP